MKYSLIIVICSAFCACQNNEIETRVGETANKKEIPVKTIEPYVSPKHDTVFVECGFTGEYSKTEAVYDSILICVESRIICSDKIVDSYEVKDTVYGIRDQMVEITVKAGEDSKVIVVTRENFRKEIGDRNTDLWVMGTTGVEKIDHQNKKIIFTTFMGRPFTDNGVVIEYSVSYEGEVKFIRFIESEMGG